MTLREGGSGNWKWMDLLDVIVSGQVFLFFWNKFKYCGINLACNFMIREKMWVLKTQPVENHCYRTWIMSIYVLLCYRIVILQYGDIMMDINQMRAALRGHCWLLWLQSTSNQRALVVVGLVPVPASFLSTSCSSAMLAQRYFRQHCTDTPANNLPPSVWLELRERAAECKSHSSEYVLRRKSYKVIIIISVTRSTCWSRQNSQFVAHTVASLMVHYYLQSCKKSFSIEFCT